MNRLDGKNIYFLGFMATGKSRIGSELALLLNWEFLDADILIEKKAGKPITQIFQQDGEPCFRNLESGTVLELSRRSHCVIALGGGAVLDAQNWQVISTSGITICLTADKEQIFKRMYNRNDRPLMLHESPEELLEKIDKKLIERRPYYQRADLIFENTDAIQPRVLARRIYDELVKNP